MASGGNAFISPEELIEITGVSEGNIVADLGAGAGGYFSIPFAHRVGVTGKVYAVDILPEVLETINHIVKVENLVNVETIWTNLEVPKATKITENSVDYSFLINVLFQNSNKEAILAEASRILKQDGILVTVDWRANKVGFGPTEDLLVDQSDLQEMVIAMGYELVDSGDIGEYHFFAIYKKK